MDLGARLSNQPSGIQLENERINNLLFADDLALLADTEDDMFDLLRVLQSWCDDFKMDVAKFPDL